MRNLAIIPSRSKSRRVKHKNIKLIAGRPLIFYQIDCAKKVKEIDKIIVATDSSNYAKLAKSFGVETMMRPQEISGPDSRSEETLIYVINELEKKKEYFDNVILLQATSPLNEPKYLKEAIKLMATKKFKSILTYCDFRGFFLDNEEDLIKRPMTQKMKPMKMETGCFWITDIKELKKTKNRICKPFGLVKVSELASMDIDTPEELFVVEKILERKINIDENRYYKKMQNLEIKKEKDYFDAKPDPDGVIRDLSKEKERRINLCKKEIEFINSLYNGNTKKKFLDIGCGFGFVSSQINDRLYDKYGLEPSKKGFEIAKKYIPNIKLGNLKEDNYEEEFFDVIFCNHVIEHTEEPMKFIKIIHKILKTHGHLIISSPNFDSGAARRFKEKYRLLHDKTHISLFTDFSLKQMLEDFGFIVDYIDYPFFDTEYFTKENLLRLFDTTKVSPPFYGNFMTFYARKK
jgi:CMP-N-acetylneuraminic acid synthetase/ubiquinone/menaquinone biosynthesis C-methylase UbiE